MARVTVEDCILNVPNRFDLVILAAQRAKQISSGNPLTVDRDNDKDAVVALREIAEKTVEPEKLREDVVQSFSKRQAPETLDKETEEKQPLSKEIEETFAETQRQAAAEDAGEEEGDKPMSFAQDNIEVED